MKPEIKTSREIYDKIDEILFEWETNYLITEEFNTKLNELKNKKWISLESLKEILDEYLTGKHLNFESEYIKGFINAIKTIKNELGQNETRN